MFLVMIIFNLGIHDHVARPVSDNEVDIVCTGRHKVGVTPYILSYQCPPLLCLLVARAAAEKKVADKIAKETARKAGDKETARKAGDKEKHRKSARDQSSIKRIYIAVSYTHLTLPTIYSV